MYVGQRQKQTLIKFIANKHMHKFSQYAYFVGHLVDAQKVLNTFPTSRASAVAYRVRTLQIVVVVAVVVVFARVLLLCILRRAFLKRACGSETAILVCAYVVVVAERDIAEFTEIHRDLQSVIGN